LQILNKKAKTPFRFFECIALFMPTGKKAANLREFVELVKVVSPQVIFHHLHQFFLKGVYQPWDYPNDFAHWAAFGLEDLVLAEKLSNLDPYNFSDIEKLREAVVDIIEEHMWESPIIPWSRPGQEFFFNESYTIVVPTGIEAETLREIKRTVPERGLYVVRITEYAIHLQVWHDIAMTGMVDIGTLVEKGRDFLQILEPVFDEFLAIVQKVEQRDELDFTYRQNRYKEMKSFPAKVLDVLQRRALQK